MFINEYSIEVFNRKLAANRFYDLLRSYYEQKLTKLKLDDIIKAEQTWYYSSYKLILNICNIIEAHEKLINEFSVKYNISKPYNSIEDILMFKLYIVELMNKITNLSDELDKTTASFMKGLITVIEYEDKYVVVPVNDYSKDIFRKVLEKFGKISEQELIIAKNNNQTTGLLEYLTIEKGIKLLRLLQKYGVDSFRITNVLSKELGKINSISNSVISSEDVIRTNIVVNSNTFSQSGSQSVNMESTVVPVTNSRKAGLDIFYKSLNVSLSNNSKFESDEDGFCKYEVSTWKALVGTRQKENTDISNSMERYIKILFRNKKHYQELIDFVNSIKDTVFISIKCKENVIDNSISYFIEMNEDDFKALFKNLLYVKSIVSDSLKSILLTSAQALGLDKDEDYKEISNIDSQIVNSDSIYDIDLSELVIRNTVKPYTHQIEAAKFLLSKRRAILADEMGVGKTLSAIIAADNIKGNKLVICPASLKLNWEKEIRKYNPTATIAVSGISDSEDIINSEWFIVNYEQLNKYILNILKLQNTERLFSVLIVDEAHYIKSVTNYGKPGSKRAKYTTEIAKNIPYVFLLTGTPMTNRPKDLYNLLKVCRHPIASNFFVYGRRYCGAIYNGYGWEFNGATNIEDLRNKIKFVMLRRTKSELLELPDKIRTFIPVKIDIKEYKKKFEEYKNARQIELTRGEHLAYLNVMKHLVSIGKINQAIDFIKDLLEEVDCIVVFSNYDKVINTIYSKFRDIAVKFTGSETVMERNKAIELFQSGNKRLFVGNLKAGGVGITLTKASTMVVVDYDWVPINHLQAEDRIHRVGQNEKVNIYYLYADNTELDSKLTAILDKKFKVISAVLDGKAIGMFDEAYNNLDSSDVIDEIIEELGS